VSPDKSREVRRFWWLAQKSIRKGRRNMSCSVGIGKGGADQIKPEKTIVHAWGGRGRENTLLYILKKQEGARTI